MKQAESGLSVKDVCRQGGFSEPTFYKWRTKHGCMEANEAARYMAKGKPIPKSYNWWAHLPPDAVT